jgi:tripartite-type tricarboxylate transporter receptor subunit TctC
MALIFEKIEMKSCAFVRRTLALLAFMLAAPSFAQGTRPIEWVVGMAPGGGSDVVARSVAAEMSKTLNQPIVVMNKPGAAHNIATDYVAKSRDVEHVLLTADFAALAANPWLYSKLPYNVDKDLTLVGMLVRFPLIMVVTPNLPIQNFKEFLAWAKTQPHGVNYASPGAGTPHHLATELLRKQSGLNLVHVPYRGGAPAVQDVMSGHLPFMLIDAGSAMPLITSGKLRAIGVASKSRISALPDVASLQEQGVKDYEAFAWQGLAVPAATSPESVQRYSKALRLALDSPLVKTRLQGLGVEVMPGTSEEMQRFAHTERERWGAVIRDAGIKVD